MYILKNNWETHLYIEPNSGGGSCSWLNLCVTNVCIIFEIISNLILASDDILILQGIGDFCKYVCKFWAGWLWF